MIGIYDKKETLDAQRNITYNIDITFSSFYLSFGFVISIYFMVALPNLLYLNLYFLRQPFLDLAMVNFMQLERLP